jgi:hypothetical protein
VLAELGFEPTIAVGGPAGATPSGDGIAGAAGAGGGPDDGGHDVPGGGAGAGRGADWPARLVLANCPFHALAVRQPELICGMNHAFVRGVLDGLGVTRLSARLVPRPGACCVEVGAEPATG